MTTQFSQKKILVIRKSLVYKFATKIIVNSFATKQDAILNYKVSEKLIFVIPNSVKDLHKTIAISNEHEILNITYAGRLHRSKGVDVLINAFNLIARKYLNTKLIIIGSGPEEENLKQLVRQLDLKDSIDFIGNISKLSVLEKFKNSYIAVVPSNVEAFGFTVIEAMSMKTLVIGANNTGIKEIIKHNITGLLFETHNYKDLAKKITWALENPDLLNQLADSGYIRFQDYYETNMAIKRDFLYFKNMINNES